MSLIEHGFFSVQEANDFLKPENLTAPHGKLPAEHRRGQPGGVLHARARLVRGSRAPAARRVWHAVHPALKGATPYLAVLVELPHAGGIRMLGNLLGDAMLPAAVGTQVRGVFEHHRQGPVPYSLMNWRRAADQSR